MLDAILYNTYQKYNRQEGTSVENQNNKPTALFETEKGYIMKLESEIKGLTQAEAAAILVFVRTSRVKSVGESLSLPAQSHPVLR
jgi:hypothetical protein